MASCAAATHSLLGGVAKSMGNFTFDHWQTSAISGVKAAGKHLAVEVVVERSRSQGSMFEFDCVLKQLFTGVDLRFDLESD